MKKENKLFRSTSDRMIFGVLGGLAHYLKADNSVVRIIYSLLTLITGIIPGIVLYLAMWVIVPEKAE